MSKWSFWARTRTLLLSYKIAYILCVRLKLRRRVCVPVVPPVRQRALHALHSQHMLRCSTLGGTWKFAGLASLDLKPNWLQATSTDPPCRSISNSNSQIRYSNTQLEFLRCPSPTVEILYDSSTWFSFSFGLVTTGEVLKGRKDL